MNEEEVEAAKDDGHKNRWAVSRWFYQKEGGKNRLNTKTLMIGTVSLFLLLSVWGILRDSDEPGTSTAKAVKAPDQVSSQQTMVDINWVELGKETIKSTGAKSGAIRTTRRKSETQPFTGLQKIKSQVGFEIPPGTMVKARLMSGASDGPTRAVLTEELMVAGESLAEVGTMLVGQGSSTEERLLIPFSHMVFKDGSQVRIEAQACDLSDKMPGLKGSNVRGQALKLSGAIGLGVVSGTAMGYQTKQNQAAGPVQPSMRDAMLNGVAVASLEQARALTSDLQNIKPLYEVPEGTSFYVLFAGGQ